MTNHAIEAYINAVAPFATAEEWDNVGLLVGSPTTPVSGVLVTLDVTPAAIEAAVAMGANLIVSHHPVIFDGLKSLPSDGMPYALAAAGISAIAAHTNLDKAKGGVNDTLAALLGLEEVRATEDGMCRIGRLPAPLSANELAERTGAVLGTSVRVSGGEDIALVAVCGGSGGDFIPALAGKADAFVTGEVKHHEWLDAARRGLTVVEAGHYATEAPVVEKLARRLQEGFPALPIAAFVGAAPYTTI